MRGYPAGLDTLPSVIRRRTAGAAAGLMLVAACTATPVVSPTSTVGESPDGGRLVVLNDEGNIVTMNPDGSDQVAITDDGGAVQYFQPIWSPGSRVLAWGQGGDDGFAVGIGNQDRAEPLVVPMDGFPFYLLWSPDEMRIGALHNGLNGAIDFEVVDVGAGTADVIDSGSPYYFSWSPEGDALAVHVDGSRLEIHDESADPLSLGEVTPNFLAPQWTPAGLFYFGSSGLMIRDTTGSSIEVLKADGFVSINPNPEGTKVALHVLSGEQPGVTVGLTSQETAEQDAISIVDIESGEVDVVAGRIPVGSFWSPDGTKLLMLLISNDRGLVDIQLWSNGVIEAIDTVAIAPSMVNQVLPFLDQYTQSLQLWSPDSRSFVLPATRGDESGIWVYGDEGETPTRISAGEWVSWSNS
jgi:hypothetical protein